MINDYALASAPHSAESTKEYAMNANAFRPAGIALCLFLLATPPQAHAERAVDETRSLAADAAVEIQNMRGSLVITGGSGDVVVIRGSLGDGARDLLIEGDAKRLRIKVDYPESGGGWGRWWGGSDLGDSHLRIELPRTVSLTARTVSASIEVKGVDGSRLVLETVSGDVSAGSASAEVEVDSVSGDLLLNLNAATMVDVETVSGDVELRGALRGRIKAEAVSGDLDLRTDGVLEDAKLSVVSGDITLEAALGRDSRASINSLSGDVSVLLPAATSAELRIETFSGRIDSEVGKVEKEEYGPGARLRHQIGAGEADLRMESFSGNVRLRLK